ncbi:MAG TPA: chemotaxis protein CheW [Spirochaetia bacterium]|nr:chemotaxis protein CheW [Spirochaetia bacterium]
MEIKAEYLAMFTEEANDQLREWEECLLTLEKSPRDSEPLHGMFRAIHTLKGSAGFIGFDRLQKVTHDLESSLSDARDGNTAYNQRLGEILFKGLDLCRGMIDAFAAGKADAEGVEEFQEMLARVARNEGPGAKQAVPPASQAAAAPAVVSALSASASASPARSLSIRIEGQPREAYLRSFLVKARLEGLGKIVAAEPSPEALRQGDGPFVYTVTIETGRTAEEIVSEVALDQVSITAATPAPVVARVEAEETVTQAEREAHSQFPRGARSDEVVRVSVQKLDALLNLVGELVVHNSGFIVTTQQLGEQYGKSRLIRDLEEKTEALSAITHELQDGIMKARMLPIATVFARFRRVVRDLAKASGKSVALDLFGEETEIDKKVIDRIGEPLVHLVRNAVDHGLEPSDERAKRGKNAQGTIRLGAYQDGDHICLELSDDGRGLDREAILRKALEKGLIKPEEVASASTERVLGFIFLPGFSTARKVTDISGRGVGMDAVKRAVEELGGTVRIRSAVGVGTTVTISLPLTMAIITAVLVEADGSIFAIPLSAVREILKEKDAILRTVRTRRVIMLRDEVLALVNLGAALRDARDRAPEDKETGLPVVVVDFEGKKIGLEVEKILGTREVVIKSLSRHYREVEGLVGASILGNGKIALIVDVETLIGLYCHHDSGKSVTMRGVAFDSVESAPPNDTLEPDQPASLQPGPVPAVEHRAAATAAHAIEELAGVVSGDTAKGLEMVHNAGAIQASISLSQLVGREIQVSFPESRMVPIGEVADLMGGDEAPVGGIYVGVGGDITGGILLVFPQKNLLAIDDVLHGRPAGTSSEPAQLDLSGLSEVGNILACCFINAFADADGLMVHAEVPEISIDMCLPVVDSVLARFNQQGEKILLTEAVVYAGDMQKVVCHQLLFLEPESLTRLMAAFSAKPYSARAAVTTARAGGA